MAGSKARALRNGSEADALKTASAKALEARLLSLQRQADASFDLNGIQDATAALRTAVVERGYIWSEGYTRSRESYMFGLLLNGKPVRWYVTDAEEAHRVASEALEALSGV